MEQKKSNAISKDYYVIDLVHVAKYVWQVCQTLVAKAITNVWLAQKASNGERYENQS